MTQDSRELEFKFAEVREEIDSFGKLARDFIEAGSDRILRDYADFLEHVRNNPSKDDRTWQIEKTRPLRTTISTSYDRKAGRKLCGSMSTIWQIRHLPEQGTKKRPRPCFQLVGKASTILRLIEVDADGSEQDAAMWRAEIGDQSSPGCHFHLQILGEQPSAPFPKHVPVPRLPSLCVSPMIALESLLAELFQDEWRRTTMSAQSSPWHGVQRRRLQALFEWQLKQVKESPGHGSPWSFLKTRKPPADLFTK